MTLEDITTNIKVCKNCRLYEAAKNPVPGEGNPKAAIAFVGEAPGATEDATGRPFVGRAGKLLEAGLKKIGYAREDVWIGNVIKHRPPENRDPLPDEIKACEKYLALQLNTISPKLVVTLGRFAMNYFYPDGKITRDRGHLVQTKGFNIYPIYHPAAALRNGNMMETFKKDFVRIPNVLNEIINKKDETTSQSTDGQLGLEI